MLTIDMHTHILPPRWPSLREKYGYGGFVHMESTHAGCARMMIDDKLFREVTSNVWDPAVRLQDCDRHGVHVQVLSTVPVMFAYWAKPEDTLDLARMLNNHIASVVAENPRRFVGLGTVPLQAPDLAIRELERCKQELGFCGVQIGSHVQKWNLNEPALFPFFEAAQDLDAAIFVHPWDMMGTDRMPNYWLPWLVGMPAEVSLAICSLIFGGVLERLPQLRIAFSHGGGAFPSTIGRISHGFQVRPDLCAVDNAVDPRTYLSRLYVDSLVHDSLQLRYIMDCLGSDRIALGSDYPFPLGEEIPGTLIAQMNLSHEVQARLLAGTALEWMGRSAKDFVCTT